MVLVVLGLSVILRDQNRNVIISSGMCLVLCGVFFAACYACKMLGDNEYRKPGPGRMDARPFLRTASPSSCSTRCIPEQSAISNQRKHEDSLAQNSPVRKPTAFADR